MLTVKTDTKIDIRLRTTTRHLDTAIIPDEAFHLVATSDLTTTEAEIETITTPGLATKIEAFAITTRKIDAMIVASLAGRTMTNLDRAHPTTATVAAIGAATETAIATETEIDIPINDLETGVAPLTVLDAQTVAD